MFVSNPLKGPRRTKENGRNPTLKPEVESQLSNSKDNHKLTKHLGKNTRKKKKKDNKRNVSSSDDDEKAELLTEELEEGFLKILSGLKKKDPKLKDFEFYLSQEPGTSQEKKVLNNYKNWLKGKQEPKEDNNTLKRDLEALHNFWTNPHINKDEQFLRDYILNKKFLDHDDGFSLEKELATLDEEEQELNRELLFEEKYNFRFEQSDTESIDNDTCAMLASGKKNKKAGGKEKQFPNKGVTTSKVKNFSPQAMKPVVDKREKNGEIKNMLEKKKRILDEGSTTTKAKKPVFAKREKNEEIKNIQGKKKRKLNEGSTTPKVLAMKPVFEKRKKIGEINNVQGEEKRILDEGSTMPKQIKLIKHTAKLAALRAEKRKTKLRHRIKEKKIKLLNKSTTGKTTGPVKEKHQKPPIIKAERIATFIKEKKQKLKKMHKVQRKHARVRAKKGSKPVRV